MTFATVRRIGNSLGIVFPKAEADRLRLHPGDRVDVDVRKTAGLDSIFGALQGRMGDLDALLHEIDEAAD